MRYEIEICVEADTPLLSDSVRAAVDGGAHRIELCAGMNVGGITPGADTIQQAMALARGSIEVMVMIRPRGGDFFYSRHELDKMISSIGVASDAGADGVVFGILSPPDPNNPQPSIDLNSNLELVTIAKSLGLTTTFHRAIDALPNPCEAAVLIQSLGFDRILVSGIPWEAVTSVVERFKTLHSIFDRVKGLPGGHIELVLAGGISPGNARSLIRELGAFGQPFSLHTYSGVRVDGQTDRQAVSQLVSVVN